MRFSFRAFFQSLWLYIRYSEFRFLIDRALKTWVASRWGKPAAFPPQPARPTSHPVRPLRTRTMYEAPASAFTRDAGGGKTTRGTHFIASVSPRTPEQVKADAVAKGYLPEPCKGCGAYTLVHKEGEVIKCVTCNREQ